MFESTELEIILDKADRIALLEDWKSLTDQTLHMLAEFTCSEAALLFWPGMHADQQPWQGSLSRLNGDAEDWNDLRECLARQSFFKDQTAQVLDKKQLEASHLVLTPWLPYIDNMVVLPLTQTDQDLQDCCAGILLLNASRPSLYMARRVARRMSSDIGKSARRERERRIKELDKIYRQQGATLDPDQVLKRFFEQVGHYLQVEAISLFMVDEAQGDYVLSLAWQLNKDYDVEQIRVPAGKGIIGSVIQGGETVLVSDAYSDPRFYGAVDNASGFITRSILAVPLVARSIDLGQERGVYSEHIIGGIEAINKMNGRFLPEDEIMLKELSNRAATELTVANLWKESNQLFEDFTEALVDAIDERDKKNPGHSRRVSKYSVEIGLELGLPPEDLYHLRIGSMLHDIGKVGIPDSVLNFPGKLGPRQWKKMKQHPTIGEKIIRKVRQLARENPDDARRLAGSNGSARRLGNELAAIAEHHEKLNGTGYPRGLNDQQITDMGRIVAVADVFDALTSNRPYRKPMSVEEAFDFLQKNMGTHFEPAYVEALISAYLKGRFRTDYELAVMEKSRMD